MSDEHLAVQTASVDWKSDCGFFNSFFYFFQFLFLFVSQRFDKKQPKWFKNKNDEMKLNERRDIDVIDGTTEEHEEDQRADPDDAV